MSENITVTNSRIFTEFPQRGRSKLHSKHFSRSQFQNKPPIFSGKIFLKERILFFRLLVSYSSTENTYEMWVITIRVSPEKLFQIIYLLASPTYISTILAHLVVVVYVWNFLRWYVRALWHIIRNFREKICFKFKVFS